MAIFEFKCKSCNKTTDEFYKMGECPETIKCIHCGETSARVWTYGGNEFKGTGFHVNDYGSN